MKTFIMTFIFLQAFIWVACGGATETTADAPGDESTDSISDHISDFVPDVIPDTNIDAADNGHEGTEFHEVVLDTYTDNEDEEMSSLCGNGTIDYGEECDDSNFTDGDGCDNDCTYSCHNDGECDDLNKCTGDTCNLETHICRHDPIECDDWDPCTYDTCDPGEGCVFTPMPYWYPDEDEDGYGIPHGAICSMTPIPGYADNDDDCCDSNELVHPDQVNYFSLPYMCSPGGEWSFDYNCNGIEEKRWTDFGWCELDSSGTCVSHEGWLPDGGMSIPPCGQGGAWIGPDSCILTAGRCGVNAGIVTIQECR